MTPRSNAGKSPFLFYQTDKQDNGHLMQAANRSFTPGTSESNSPHQSWLISNPDTTNLSLVTIYNLASKVYITAPLGVSFLTRIVFFSC